MKRLSFNSLMWIVLLSVSLPVFAYDFTVDGLYYNILPDQDKPSVEVTYEYESMAEIVNPYVNDATGDVFVPKELSYEGVTYTVTRIGDVSFCHCFGLNSITIPSTITSIGEDAFYNTYDVSEIYCRGQVPPVIMNSSFTNDVKQKAIVYVPIGSKEAYQGATYWKEFANIVESDFSEIEEVADSK